MIQKSGMDSPFRSNRRPKPAPDRVKRRSVKTGERNGGGSFIKSVRIGM